MWNGDTDSIGYVMSLTPHPIGTLRPDNLIVTAEEQHEGIVFVLVFCC